MLQVFITGSVDGEPDILERFLTVLRTVNIDGEPKDYPPFQYRHIEGSYPFIVRKEPKEQPVTDGILRANWISKHFEQLPSVVAMLTTFCVDWSAGEWIRRESIAQEYLSQIRSKVSGRDVKIIVVAIKTGTAALEKDVIEERTSSMKRHLQLDSRFLCLITLNELYGSSSSMRKIVRLLREHSFNYYAGQSKRVKAIDRSLGKTAELILLARYNFKSAYLNEFHGQLPRALRHYRQSHACLLEIINWNDDDEYFKQILQISAWCNFKILKLLLLNGNLKEAFSHFTTHIITLKGVTKDSGGTFCIWEHKQWIADQYIIFAQLLQLLKINMIQSECDLCNFYQSAARETLFRRDLFQSTATFVNDLHYKVVPDLELVQASFPGMTFSPSKYVGGSMVIFDPVLDEVCRVTDQVKQVLRRLAEQREMLVDHTARAIELFSKSLTLAPVKYRRVRAHVMLQLAEQFLRTRQYERANASLVPCTEYLTNDGWSQLSIPVYRLKLTVSMYLGRLRDALAAAVRLYAALTSAPQSALTSSRARGRGVVVLTRVGSTDEQPSNALSTSERLSLHQDIMSILSCSSVEDVCAASSSDTLSSTTAKEYFDSFESTTPRWPEYGSFASEDHPKECHIPDGHVINIPYQCSLIDVRVRLSESFVAVGDLAKVDLEITSNFADVVKFDEMKIHFLRDVHITTFIAQNGQGSNDADAYVYDSEVAGKKDWKETLGTVSVPLVFVPNVPNIYSFIMKVPEAALHLPLVNGKHLLVIDRICLKMKVQQSAADLQRYKLEYDNAVDQMNKNKSPGPSEEARNRVVDTIETGEEDSFDESFTPFTSACADVVDVQTDDLQLIDGTSAGDSIGNDVCDSKSIDFEHTVASLNLTVDVSNSNSAAYAADEVAHRRMEDAPAATSSDVIESCGRIAMTGCREIVFDVATIPRELSTGIRGHTPSAVVPKSLEKPYYESYPWQGKLFHRSSPPSLLVRAPEARIELLKPEVVPSREDISGSMPVSILQGVIHRIDFVFDSKDDEVHNGCLYLSVDPPPASTKSAFFWIPKVPDTTDDTLCTEENIDRVPFHPLALDSESLQPVGFIRIPSQKTDSVFGNALYVMSEIAGMFTITLKLEYVNSSLLSIPVTKEFNIKCEVVRPFAVNFTIASLKDAPSGVPRNLLGTSNEISTFVLKDDVISVSTSMACLNALGSTVEILGLKLIPSQEVTSSNGISFESNECNMLLSMAPSLVRGNGSEGEDALGYVCSTVEQAANRSCVSLKRGELFVGRVNVRCSSAGSEQSQSTVSIGSVEVEWRLRCPLFLAIPKLNAASDVDPEKSSSFKELSSSLSWLWPLSTDDDLNTTETRHMDFNIGGLDLSVVAYRTCRMSFAMPPVRVCTFIFPF